MRKFWFHNQIYLYDSNAPTIVHQDLIENFLGFQLTLLYFLFVHSMWWRTVFFISVLYAR